MARHLTSPRVKGETASPAAAMALVDKIGVTRAAKEIGTSTTTLHKARKAGVISKVVEVAASHALEHLGDVQTAPIAVSRPTNGGRKPEPTLLLIEVAADKAPAIRRVAEALGAEIIQA